MEEQKTTALVISGGGAKGAFAAGVVKHLYLTYRSTGWFKITCGTSTGALISPMAALMGAPDPIGSQALDTLVRMYTTVSTSDILRKRHLLEWLYRRDCLNESDPLTRLVRRNLSQEWFEWLQRPDAPECYVVYVNYQTGKLVKASPKSAGMNRKRFIQAMLASASVPIIMEPTMIDGDVCFDGGVRDLLPFGKAIELGADTILPIFLDPEECSETEDSFKRADKILLRTFAIMVNETGINDFKVAKLINIGIRMKDVILRTFKDNTAVYMELKDILEKDEFQELIGEGKRLVTLIEGLRPDKTLTEDSLTFDPDKMKDWVSLGEEKAKEIIKQSPFV